MTDTPTYARPVEGDLSVGHIFNRAWDIFAAKFWQFVIITAIVALPNTLLLFSMPTTPDAGFAWQVFAGLLVGLVLNMIAQAVILYIAFQYLRGQSVSLGDAVQKGLARFLPILGVVILAMLGLWVGFMLLIVPGIMLMVRWSVAMPACVVEQLGPVASLKRSAVLTKGHRWKIFGIFVLIWLASVVVGAVIGFASGLLGAAATLIANFVWTAVWTAYFNGVWVMIYHDLRVAKEGVDIEQIAAVFD